MRPSLQFLLALSLFVGATSSYAQQASNVVICKKTSSGAVTLRTKKCKSGETKVSNISSLTGNNGANGADGSLRIYGDGSAGELHITTNTTLSDPNLQYTNILIDVGVQLNVPTGVVLRCNGTFRNRGTIVVNPEGNGTYTDSNTTNALTVPSRSAPAAAHVARVASNGEYGESSRNLVGGLGGTAHNSATLKSILKPGDLGGGPGGGAGRSTEGAQGGGTITVLAAGALSNEGLISADGEDAGQGTGGGAGGFVILASKSSVSNTGTISVTGGDGGNSVSYAAAGGGGGGGVVHFLAPSITAGTITLTPGAAGSTATAVTATMRAAGSGGGAGGGDGGYGSDVDAVTSSPSNRQSGASAGAVGQSFSTTGDPTALF